MVFRLENRQTIRSLTSLKGIFIWIIVLHNTFLLDTVLDHLPGMPFIRLFGGSLGNSMFFMLSGFLMALGYREKIAQRQISFEDLADGAHTLEFFGKNQYGDATAVKYTFAVDTVMVVVCIDFVECAYVCWHDVITFC